ncbi:MAG: reverse transcriptase family protein, partial [Trichodesmium sp. St2_bin2_1]|nr:reverse transcriptase family protein [Trichodesmium sp. St2_bin2_1]
MRLTDKASLLTTFLTPYGRFRYTRAPMGLSSSGDEFCRRGDKALRGVDGVIKVVDDVLVHAPTLGELEARVRAVLAACRRARITMSAKKFVFGATTAAFVGFVVGPDGYHPDPAKLRAISEFPEPANITDVRSFFGLANQLNGFTGRVAEALQPLRPMLSPKSAFVWEEPQREAFRQARRLLSEVPIRAFYDPAKPVTLLTDAAHTRGLGYALVQGEECQYHPVATNSRVLSPAEANYSATELELLAVVWAFEQCKIYLLGLEADMCTVVVDHAPLRGKFKKSLDQEENPRILRLLEKLRPYNFKADWTEGKRHRI